jgi:hypothetical protein
MIRFTKIIKKDDLWNLMEDPLISKIEILRRENNLRDQTLCKIHFYVFVNFWDVCTMLGSIKKHGGKDPLFNGIQGIKGDGFIKGSILKKIRDKAIEKDIKIDFPKYFFELIDKYDELHDNK